MANLFLFVYIWRSLFSKEKKNEEEKDYVIEFWSFMQLVKLSEIFFLEVVLMLRISSACSFSSTFFKFFTDQSTGFCYFLLLGVDYSESRRKPQILGKLAMAFMLTALCILVLKQSPSFSGPGVVCFIQINLGNCYFSDFLFFMKKKKSTCVKIKQFCLWWTYLYPTFLLLFPHPYHDFYSSLEKDYVEIVSILWKYHQLLLFFLHNSFIFTMNLVIRML